MVWVALLLAAVVGGFLVLRLASPLVPEERVAPEDLDLVRERDRAAWRKVRLRTYRSWKRQDDFYRIAAYRKSVEKGMSAEEAKAYVRKEFPIFYLDPAARGDDAYVGDDAALPILLRERVNRAAPVLKTMMAERYGHLRTMNALIREFIRQGAI